MTSTPFVFDADDDSDSPPVDGSADRSTSSMLLPSGELDFDAYVAVSSPVGLTGGDDVEMTDAVEMLNRIDTSGEKSLLLKLIRLPNESVSSVCRGVIGGSNGSRFCTKTDCRTASHQHQKVNVLNDVERYYIGAGRGGQAHTEPCIPTSWITDENERNKLEASEKPLGVWKLFFKRLEASIKDTEGKQGNSDEFAVSKELAEIDAAKENFKTPKRPAPATLITMVETALKRRSSPQPFKRKKLVRFKNQIKTEDSVEAKLVQLGVVLDQWNQVLEEIESLQTTQDQGTTSNGQFKENVLKTICELQITLNTVEDMGRLLNEDIGVPVAELQGMTLWEAIEKLVYDISSTTTSIEGLKVQSVTPEKFNLMMSDIIKCNDDISKLRSLRSQYQDSKTQMQQMEINLIKFKDHYMKFHAYVKQAINNFQMTNVSQPSSTSFTFHQPGGKNNNVTSNQATNDIRTKITDIEAVIASLQIELQDLQNSLRSGGTASDLEKINDRVKEIESRVSGDSCSINHGEFIFTSITEVTSWLERESVPTMGIFWDVFSVLVAMAPKRLTGKERADQQFSSDRINTTTAENELAASMAYERPQTLYGDKNGNLVPWEEGFGSCKTHEKWIIGTQSFKTVTTKQLKKFINGIIGNLTTGVGGSGLARVLLNEVSRQWNEIVAFIDAFFQDLTETAHFPKNKAWLLVGQCCGAIFDAMEPYRAVVSQIEDLGVLSSQAQFLWCVLQCHRVMNDFIAKDFRGHPQMVKQISLFMINERVDPVAFLKLETKVHDQASIIDNLEKQVATLKRTVGNHEVFRKEINDLQRDLKKKQDK